MSESSVILSILCTEPKPHFMTSYVRRKPLTIMLSSKHPPNSAASFALEKQAGSVCARVVVPTTGSGI